MAEKDSEISRLKESVLTLEKRAGEVSERDKLLVALLVDMQGRCDKNLARAEEDARQMREDAGLVLEDARRQAEKTVEDAGWEAEQILGVARQRAEALMEYQKKIVQRILLLNRIAKEAAENAAAFSREVEKEGERFFAELQPSGSENDENA